MLEEFDETVLHFMDEWGTNALYIRKSSGTYDPATGTLTATPQPMQVRGILMDYTLQSNGLKYRYGTEVLDGDKQFFMQPPSKTEEGLPPLFVNPVTDQIRIGSTTYNIVTMKEVNPTGDNAVLYEFLLRR